MADTAIAITAGTGTNVDTRTEGTNGNHRQVVVLGDPATNAGVAPVDATAGLKVDLGTDNDITGTVTANLSATDNAVLDALVVDTGEIQTAVEAIQAGQLADGHNVTVDNSTGAAAVNIQDGGNTITVDGTVAVTHAALTELGSAINSDKLDVNIVSSDVATGGTSAADDADFTAGTTPGTPSQGVYESTPTSVTDGDLGTVGITSGRRLKTSATIDAALPAGTNAIGKLAANSGVDIGDVDVTSSALPTGASTSAKQDTVIGHLDGVETLLTTIAGDTTDIEAALETVGGLVVNLGTNNDVTVTGAVDLGATDNAVLDAIAASTAAIETAVEGTLTVTGGGGGTEYTEDAAAAANPVGNALILVREDGRAGSLTTTDGDNVALRGNNKGEAYVKTTDSDALLTTIDADTGNISTKIDTIAGAVSGTEVQVDVLTMPTVTVNAHAVTNAGTFATQVDGAALTSLQLADDVVATLGTTTYTEASTKGTTIGAVRRDADTTLVDTTNEIGPLQMDANGRLKVEAFSGETLPVSLTSTTVTGTVAVTQSGTWDEVGINDSGNSITVDYATTGSGTATGALRVELPTNGTGTVGLNAGTNAIGKLAANSGVDIGDVTLTAGTAAVGTLLPPDVDVTAHTNYAKKYYTNSGAVTDGIIWSPAAGKRWHILSLTINVSAAATVTLEDDKSGGDEAVMKFEFAANSGITIPFSEKYPFASGEDAADLIITTSAGNVYVTCVGYEI